MTFVVFFVKMSASLSSDFTNLMIIFPYSWYSFTKEVLISLCFVLSLVVLLLDSQIAPTLSTYAVMGNSTSMFIVCRKWMTEFRQPLQVQSHLEMPRILVQLGHTQRTWKLAPQTDPKWSPTWSLTRFQPICPLSARDGRYACQVSRAHRTHSRL